MVNDLAISLVFTTLGDKPKKFNFVHQTVSHREVHVGVGTRLLYSLFTSCPLVSVGAHEKSRAQSLNLVHARRGGLVSQVQRP